MGRSKEIVSRRPPAARLRQILLTTAFVLFALTSAQAIARTESPCDTLMSAYVIDGLVDYDRLAGDPLLDRCVEYIQNADAEAMSDRNTELAFWINAYNITVISSVIQHGMPSRVTDVRGFFNREKHEVAGSKLTLDEIENSVIRPFGDSRIHAALVCAATSCPELQPWAFTGDSLDSQLTRVSRMFLADRSRNDIDFAERRAHLSKVFDWYAGDFVKEYGSVMAFVVKFSLENELPASSSGAEADSITPRYLDYDWSLNRPGASE